MPKPNGEEKSKYTDKEQETIAEETQQAVDDLDFDFDKLIEKKSLESEKEKEEEPKKDEPVKTPVEEPKEPKEPKEPEKKKEEELKKPEEPEEPEEEIEKKLEEPEKKPKEKEPEVDPLDEMRERLNAMAIQKEAPVPEPKEKVVEEPKVEKEVVIPPAVVATEKPIEFVTADDMENLTSDHEAMNKLLNKVRNQTRQETLINLPSIVQSMVNEQVAIRTMRADFFRKNPDLAKYTEFCIYTANEIAAENTGLNYEQLFEKTELIARQRLKLEKKAGVKEVEDGKKNSPAFVKKQRAQRPPDKTEVDEQQQEIDDL